MSSFAIRTGKDVSVYVCGVAIRMEFVTRPLFLELTLSPTMTLARGSKGPN